MGCSTYGLVCHSIPFSELVLSIKNQSNGIKIVTISVKDFVDEAMILNAERKFLSKEFDEGACRFSSYS